MTADTIIALLELKPHPREDGYFRETYRSDIYIATEALPERYTGPRNSCTAIYFLLKEGNISAFHKVKSDEMFHYYGGGPAEQFVIDSAGHLTRTIIGSDCEQGQSLQTLVPRDCWQALRPLPGAKYLLVGCTVAPGFDYADYEHGKREDLLSQFPQHAELIEQLSSADRG